MAALRNLSIGMNASSGKISWLTQRQALLSLRKASIGMNISSNSEKNFNRRVRETEVKRKSSMRILIDLNNINIGYINLWCQSL